MKTIFFHPLIFIVLFTGCFRDDEAQIQLSLTNTSTSEELHIAVLEGDSVLESKSFKESAGEASLSVPSGKKVTFVIVGTNSSNEVLVYGSADVDTNGDDVQSVGIDLTDASWNGVPNDLDISGNRTYWTSTNIVNTVYQLEDDGTDEIVYEGTETEYFDLPTGGYYFYVIFYPFELRTPKTTNNYLDN